MPNCVIEYSLKHEEEAHIDLLCKVLHQVMVDSALFDSKAIKTRAFAYQHCCIGNDFNNTSFLQITVSLLAGRTPEKKKALSNNLHKKAKEICTKIERISVEIRDMDKDSYTK